MDDIRDQLMRKAYLYVDATAYQAGVDAALSAVAAQRDAATTTDQVDRSTGEDAITVLALNR